VVLVDSNAEAMQAAASSIRAGVPTAEIVPVVADVGREETAALVVAEAKKMFGALDVLVNLAGIRAYEPLAEAKRETWDTLIKSISSAMRILSASPSRCCALQDAAASSTSPPRMPSIRAPEWDNTTSPRRVSSR